MRAWENVREPTLSSSPRRWSTRRGSLIKRAIRDLYNKDIDEVLVSGDEGYREAKDFMRMLMPSHAKAGEGLQGAPTPLFCSLRGRGTARCDVLEPGLAQIGRTISSSIRPRRSSRSTSIPGAPPASTISRIRRSRPILRPRTRWHASCVCAISPGLIRHRFHRHGREAQQPRWSRSASRTRSKERPCTHPDRADIAIRAARKCHAKRMRTGVLESSSVVCPTCGGSGFVRATPSDRPDMCCAPSRKPLLKGRQRIDITVRTHFRRGRSISSTRKRRLRCAGTGGTASGSRSASSRDETLHLRRRLSRLIAANPPCHGAPSPRIAPPRRPRPALP